MFFRIIFNAFLQDWKVDMKHTMGQRFRKLKTACQSFKVNGSEFQFIERSKLDHIVVNDKYKVLYCYVPKVACTNLKRVFLMLTGKLNVTDPLELQSTDVHSVLNDDYLTYLDSYTASEIKDRLTNYKKVVFVREPLERLLSAYRNKFLDKGNTYFKERFGRKIIKMYRENASAESLESGKSVTFSEFIRFLLDRKTEQGGYNEHWRPFFDLCYPCHIHYNFIGKYESLDEDVEGLLKLLQVDDWIRFPKRGDNYKSLKTEDLFLKFYKTVDSDMLRDIVNVYSKDFDIFDYEVPKGVQRLLEKAKG